MPWYLMGFPQYPCACTSPRLLSPHAPHPSHPLLLQNPHHVRAPVHPPLLASHLSFPQAKQKKIKKRGEGKFSRPNNSPSPKHKEGAVFFCETGVVQEGKPEPFMHKPLTCMRTQHAPTAQQLRSPDISVRTSTDPRGAPSLPKPGTQTRSNTPLQRIRMERAAA